MLVGRAVNLQPSAKEPKGHIWRLPQEKDFQEARRPSAHKEALSSQVLG